METAKATTGDTKMTMIVTLANKKKVELENCANFGDFSAWDIVGGKGHVITFNGRYYDTRSNRKYAEWCASRFDPEHAKRHMKKMGV